MFGFYRHRWSIDLGSNNIRICRDGDIVLDEPAVVLRDDDNGGRFFATGKEAFIGWGRVGNIKIVHPMLDGDIADFEAFEYMMKTFRIELLNINHRVGHVLVAVSDYVFSTPVALQAFRVVIERTFARKVSFISSAAAVAVSLGFIRPKEKLKR